MDDPSPTMHDPNTQSQQDYTYREALEAYFQESLGSGVEKMENFTKYTPRQTLARFLARYEIFKLIENVHGSIVECGVLFGGGLMGFANISTILEPYNFQRKIIGFDTFSGFPEVAAEDLEGLLERKSTHLKKGGFAAPNAYEDLKQSIEVFNKNRFLSHFSKVEVIKGDFEETCEKYISDHPHLVISCLYLDFDIYKPTKVAIEKLVNRIPKGGVIVFDELNEEAFPGETIAVMEMIGIPNLRIRRFTFEPRISYAVIGE
ncbi:class I SAM-dependent methyltransferase [Paenibacillus whitsoniae]|uniref:Class I SAM-dependent methyltransferase n=2 Tax=Paenibacillus whitsoniae TaxID=2496558 RepID=A0A3S0C7S6_9BACL|nr:class I SAM-dependent methyltransferase [Paenibacillus whitsoniae]